MNQEFVPLGEKYAQCISGKLIINVSILLQGKIKTSHQNPGVPGEDGSKDLFGEAVLHLAAAPNSDS